MRVELLRVDGWRRLTASFLRAVVRLCWELRIDPSVLLAVMAIETGGTFDPSTRNPLPGSSATGLIQFTAPTARALGTTVDALSRMTDVGQLAYVGEYFRRYGPKKTSLVDARPVDTYLVVFSPAHVGASLSRVMYADPEKAYRMNRGFDRDGDGRILVGEVAATLEAKLARARSRPPLVVEVWPQGAGLALVAVSVAVAGAVAVVGASERL